MSGASRIARMSTSSLPAFGAGIYFPNVLCTHADLPKRPDRNYPETVEKGYPKDDFLV